MSFEWYRRAHTAIAQGSLTNSKRVETFIKGVTPTHCVSAAGAKIKGVDGKVYIDFCCANGTSLFGYEHPELIRARNSAPMGPYSLGSTLEVECAELLKDRIPFVRKVRFLKSGSEACSAAIRISRAHTGRDKVLSSGYHGWHDDFVSLSAPAFGVPRRQTIEPLTSMDQIKTDIAAVIIEPVVTEHSPKRMQWIHDLIIKCKKNGVLVIFDEVITGFRWPGLTFSRDTGIHPDIICVGKAMAGGMALSAVGLAEHIGDDKEWFVSSTFAGEPAPLVVFKKVCEMLHNKYKLEELWREGKAFLEDFNNIAPDRLLIEGYPTRGVFKGDPLTKALFFQESHKAGILFGPSWFLGFQHMGMREGVVSTSKDILQRITNNQVKLEGDMPASPFAERVRAS